jgi:hypothetical protein
LRWTAQAYPATHQSRRLNPSPTAALIDLKVGCGLCGQIPVRFDLQPVIHLRITVVPGRRPTCRGKVIATVRSGGSKSQIATTGKGLYKSFTAKTSMAPDAAMRVYSFLHWSHCSGRFARAEAATRIRSTPATSVLTDAQHYTLRSTNHPLNTTPGGELGAQGGKLRVSCGLRAIPGCDNWPHAVWFSVTVTIAPGKPVVVRHAFGKSLLFNKVTHHESAPNTFSGLCCRPGAKRLCSAATQAGRAQVHATAFSNTSTAAAAGARTTAPASRGSGGTIPQRVKPC